MRHPGMYSAVPCSSDRDLWEADRCKGMRIIGLDIHGGASAEAVAWENGRVKRLPWADMHRDHLRGGFVR
jgi:hypothetical protein